MRLRFLLTNGKRTIDVIWVEHTGTDIYYGYVGAENKYSYHASGQRHTKFVDGTMIKAEPHHRLDAFRDQLQLCAFGLSTAVLDTPHRQVFTGRKGDSIVYLDARTLPTFMSISLGLVEVNNLAAMLPVAPWHDVRLMHIVPSTAPWIYINVHAIQPEA